MFTGFTDATVDFLWGIRFNNERPWFEAHKETYLSELYRPMKDLGAEIYDFLSERRPEDAMMCRVSRIYRDARRLHGRGALQGPPVVLRGTPRRGLDHPADLLV